MAKSIVEIRELEKKVTGFQEIPKGDVNVAYVFFQSKDNTKFVVTTEKKKIMAAELRIGKYDRIMTIHRGSFDTVMRKKIACKEDGHWFYVDLHINYYVKDPEYIFIYKVYEVEQVLNEKLSGIEFELGNTYGFRAIPKLERTIWELVNKSFEALDYLKLNFSMKIALDETAEIIVKREMQHEVAASDIDLSAIEEKTKTENTYDLEQLKLEREMEVARLSAELQQDKISSLAQLFERYGTNAGNLIALEKGELSGERMSMLLTQEKKEQREERLNWLHRLYKDGIINDITVEELTKQILLDNKDGSGINQKYIESQVNSAQEDSEHGQSSESGSFQWNNSQKEDGSLE